MKYITIQHETVISLSELCHMLENIKIYFSFVIISKTNKKARRLHAELCPEIESVEVVGYLVCVDLPFIDVI